MKISITRPPEEGWVAVFGMAGDKDTINNDHLFEYEPISDEGHVLTYEILPPAPRILIRVGFEGLRWRADKQYFSESLQSYCSDLLLDYQDDGVAVDLNEYLEHDYSNDPAPSRTPTLTVEDHSSYFKPSSFRSAIAENQQTASESPVLQKNIVFRIRSSDRIEFEHFKHSLPRELSWLLYGPLPISRNVLEGVFFNYNFGAGNGLDAEVLKREPWRADDSWNTELIAFKKQFVSRLQEWGAMKPYFLTSRELLQMFPRYLVQDATLQLKDVYGGNDPQLWHYFSAPKFLHLISSGEVWFSRPSVFSDPFESKTNKSTRAHQIQVVMRQMIQEYNVAVYECDSEYLATHDKWASTLSRNENGTITENTFSSFEMIPALLLSLAEVRLNAINNSLLVDCWHENETESAGMWDLYADSKFGVAITSTPERIRQSFAHQDVKLNITPIEYHDLHQSDVVFDSLPVAYKHSAFTHEREYRAYISGYPLSEGTPGVSLAADMKTLIDRIVLAPKCPNWYKSSIEWVLKAADFHKVADDSIFRSELY